MAQYFKDYYSILEVPFGASEAEIKAAYRKMARQFHPDMHPEDAEVYTAKFQEITEAYETLSDAAAKAVYDQQYRYRLSGESPVFHEYYYEPVAEYEPYQPPVESKRKTYASYAAFLVMGFYFIRIIFGGMPSATNARPDYRPAVSYGVQERTFLNTPKDTVTTAPANEVKKPW